MHWHGTPTTFPVPEFSKRRTAYTNETLQVQYSAGGQRPRKRKRYATIDRRLGTLKDRLRGQVLTRMQYADACAKLLHLD